MSAPARLIVAIDGPSSSGKSTVARGAARRLGLRYLDTGSMYRALTWDVLRRGVPPDDELAVTAVARRLPLEVGTDPESPVVRVGGADVTAAVRSAAVTRAVSAVSAHPDVRRELVARQRAVIDGAPAAGACGGIVVEGRDIGTVVAPDAPVKLFLTASADARARRRARETGGDVEDVAGALRRRDGLDSSRAAAPLTRAPDALELDTTAMTIEEAIERVVSVATAGTWA